MATPVAMKLIIKQPWLMLRTMVDFLDDSELIPLCELCGKWERDNHRYSCYPNDGTYNENEWVKILEKRREVAYRQAEKVIKKRKAELIEELILELNKLLFEVKEFKTEIRGVLRVPAKDYDSTPERERKKDDGLKGYVKMLHDFGYKVLDMESKNYDQTKISEAGKILDEIDRECSEIESMHVIHIPPAIPLECTCDDWDTIQCPQHPGRNPKHPGRD